MPDADYGRGYGQRHPPGGPIRLLLENTVVDVQRGDGCFELVGDVRDRVPQKFLGLTLTVGMGIQDTGSGIHPEDLYHIFKRFYRSRFSKDTQGIGLGAL